MHVIAAKAVALKEALQPEFRDYQRQVLANARAMVGTFQEPGYKIVSGGTDDDLFLVDLIDYGIIGKDADAALGAAHITVSKNAAPNDPQLPFVTSGIRIGTPTVTARGFREQEVRDLAKWMCDVLANMSNAVVIDSVRAKVTALCARFPVYGEPGGEKPSHAAA